jgi:hypothetical protein
MPTGLLRKPLSLWELVKALAQVLRLRLRLWLVLRSRRRP